MPGSCMRFLLVLRLALAVTFRTAFFTCRLMLFFDFFFIFIWRFSLAPRVSLIHVSEVPCRGEEVSLMPRCVRDAVCFPRLGGCWFAMSSIVRDNRASR